MSILTAITCTGGNPEAFKLCRHYMSKQTYKDEIQWICVIDNENPEYLKPLLKGLPKNIKPELYQNSQVWALGQNTHRGSLLLALDHVEGDKIFNFEHDDLFKPNFLEEMSKLLDHVEVVGEGNASYYNLRVPGWRRMGNYAHASLCQTGIRSSMLPIFKQAVKTAEKFFDVELWQQAHRQGKSCAMFTDVNLCIGIKGMPGRPGIGVGHSRQGYLADPNLDIMRKWLGSDVDSYLPFVRKSSNGKEEQSSGIQTGGKKEVSRTGSKVSRRPRTEIAQG